MADESPVIERLARVETKIDILIEDRGRLREVEKKQWLHSGGVAVIAFLLSKVGIPIQWH